MLGEIKNPPFDMTLMYESIRKTLPKIAGWLDAPTRNFCLFFILDPKSAKSFSGLMSQLWFCTLEGIPTSFKNPRKMDLDCASETWSELINNGWE